MTMAPPTGAQLIAPALRNLGVTTIFGIVGIPVVEIAEEAINIGIQFIGFRNEQAASYAATAYGYLTGKPGVCLVVGGPGVLHAIAGVRFILWETVWDSKLMGSHRWVILMPMAGPCFCSLDQVRRILFQRGLFKNWMLSRCLHHIRNWH